jgi:hypothetical protein
MDTVDVRFKDLSLVNTHGGKPLPASDGEPYELHKLPQWARRVTRKYLCLQEDSWGNSSIEGDLKGASAEYKFTSIFKREVEGLLDHWGSRTKDGLQLLVLEPYGPVEDHQLRQLNTFCQKFRLKYNIHPAAAWYPTRTLRIEIKDADELR